MNQNLESEFGPVGFARSFFWWGVSVCLVLFRVLFAPAPARLRACRRVLSLVGPPTGVPSFFRPPVCWLGPVGLSGLARPACFAMRPARPLTAGHSQQLNPRRTSKSKVGRPKPNPATHLKIPITQTIDDASCAPCIPPTYYYYYY